MVSIRELILSWIEANDEGVYDQEVLVPLADPEIIELLELIREYYFIGNNLDLMFFDPAENVHTFTRIMNNLYNKFRDTNYNVYKPVLPPMEGRKLEVFEVLGEIIDGELLVEGMEGTEKFEKDSALWDSYMKTDIFRENTRCGELFYLVGYFIPIYN